MEQYEWRVERLAKLRVAVPGVLTHPLPWAPLAKAAMAKHKLIAIEEYPETSADCNPIEHMFGNAKKPMDVKQHESPAKDEAETLSRFRAHINSQAAREEIKNSILGMPARMKAIIDNDGGPTKW